MNALSNQAKGTFSSPNTARTLDILGIKVEHHLGTEDTRGAISLFRVEAPPGAGIPLHTHEHEDETFVIEEGQLELTLGKTSRIAGAGETAFLPRAVPHAWAVHGTQRARVILIVTPGGLERYFEELATKPGESPPPPEEVVAISRRHGIEVN